MSIVKVVVVTKNNRKIVTKFRKVLDAKEFRDNVKQLKDPHISTICLITSKVKYPERDAQPEKGKLWCPYCGKHRAFKKGYRGDDYRWCEVCGVSNADFHVKKINKLEASEGGDKSYPREPNVEYKPQIREKYTVHPKIRCTQKSCQDDRIKLQWITAEERKKHKGTVIMYCPKCALKTSADARELHKWLRRN